MHLYQQFHQQDSGIQFAHQYEPGNSPRRQQFLRVFIFYKIQQCISIQITSILFFRTLSVHRYT